MAESDLAAAKTWWTGLLGIDPYFDLPFYVGYDVEGYDVEGYDVEGYELGLLPNGDPADGAHIYRGVVDVASAVHEALRHGTTEHTPPTDVGEGVITALVRNPQGSIVGFIYNPKFNRTR